MPTYKDTTRAGRIIMSAVCLGAIFASSSAQAASDKAKGAALAQQWCNSCHTVTKEDPSRKFDAGPSFVDLAKKGTFYLRVAIDKPHDFMPRFPKLSRQNKADLVAHIQSLK